MPSVEPLDSVASSFAEYGPIGAVLVVVALFIGFLVMDRRACMAERATQLKHMDSMQHSYREGMEGANTAMREMVRTGSQSISEISVQIADLRLAVGHLKEITEGVERRINELDASF